MPGGGAMFVCGPARKAAPCEAAGCVPRPHVAMCDYPVVRHGRRGTCDIKLCAAHRWAVPGQDDIDYCPAHRRLYEAEQKRLAGATAAELREHLAKLEADLQKAEARGKPVAPALLRNEDALRQAVERVRVFLDAAVAAGPSSEGMPCGCIPTRTQELSRG